MDGLLHPPEILTQDEAEAIGTVYDRSPADDMAPTLERMKQVSTLAARAYWNMFEALVEEGFGQQAAVQIIAGQGAGFSIPAEFGTAIQL